MKVKEPAVAGVSSPFEDLMEQAVHYHEAPNPSLLMDGEYLDIDLAAEYVAEQLPKLCNCLAERRYRDAEIGLSMSGMKKSYFSVLDNIKSPLLLLIVCEEANQELQAIDSVNVPSKYNLSSMYLQVLEDIGLIREAFYDQGVSSNDDSQTSAKANSPSCHVPSSFTSNFSFISMNSSPSSVVDEDPNETKSKEEACLNSEKSFSSLSTTALPQHNSSLTLSTTCGSDGINLTSHRFSFLIHLLDDLAIFVGMRIALINVYKTLRNHVLNPKTFDSKKLLEMIMQEVLVCKSSTFSCPGIKELMENHILTETQCVISIVDARCLMLSGDYVGAILACQRIDIYLMNWEHLQYFCISRDKNSVKNSSNGRDDHSPSHSKISNTALEIKFSDSNNSTSASLKWAKLCQKRLVAVIAIIFRGRRDHAVSLIGGEDADEKSVLTENMLLCEHREHHVEDNAHISRSRSASLLNLNECEQKINMNMQTISTEENVPQFARNYLNNVDKESIIQAIDLFHATVRAQFSRSILFLVSVSNDQTVSCWDKVKCDKACNFNENCLTFRLLSILPPSSNQYVSMLKRCELTNDSEETTSYHGLNESKQMERGDDEQFTDNVTNRPGLGKRTSSSDSFPRQQSRIDEEWIQSNLSVICDLILEWASGQRDGTMEKGNAIVSSDYPCVGSGYAPSSRHLPSWFNVFTPLQRIHTNPCQCNKIYTDSSVVSTENQLYIISSMLDSNTSHGVLSESFTKNAIQKLASLRLLLRADDVFSDLD